jgi:uncharacterized repeat protein (TIGR03803 family)
MHSPVICRKTAGTGFHQIMISTLTLTLLCAGVASAGTFTVIHPFTGGVDGGPSYSNLISDASGNLYGTTVWGGSTNCENGCGVVFELSPAAGGGYTETTIYTFQGGSDGWSPVTGLIFDASGNLYGTTTAGGSGGQGTVFQLTPTAGGWIKSLVFAFPVSGLSGSYPQGLVFDASGNLYGTAYQGGAHNAGAIFQLVPSSSGWVEHILHAFSGGNDGSLPGKSLIFDSTGNLYGTAYNGGAHGWGVVFQLAPQVGGTWKEVVLHTFTGGADGAGPGDGLTLDVSGNLYGTTAYGGNTTSSVCQLIGPGCGVVFKLMPTSSGWREAVMHTFTGSYDGHQPYSNLIFDSAGNAYGTAAYGGNEPSCPYTIGCGTVFKLTPGSGGGWSTSSLHRFTNKADGSSPVANLFLDSAGDLFGTASGGASTACSPTGGCGTVFEIAGATSIRRK